jgi:hypothetical protein
VKCNIRLGQNPALSFTAERSVWKPSGLNEKKYVKLSVCLANYAPCHENVNEVEV